jgi:hypothetical protein
MPNSSHHFYVMPALVSLTVAYFPKSAIQKHFQRIELKQLYFIKTNLQNGV